MTHTVFLDDIAELVKDSYSPRPNENLKYIGLEHINQQSLSLNGVGNSRELGSNKYRFRAGDILFGKLRPYFRKVYRPDFEGVCSTDIWVLRPKGDTDPDFLFYLIASEEFVSSSSGASTGTRMPRADWSHVSKTKWTLPNNPNVVGRILRSLDEKIEFNRQMNETLEQMGQALFRNYFIDNPEAKRWPINKLGAFLEVLVSGSRPKGGAIEWGVPSIGAENIGGLGIYDYSKEKYVSEDYFNNLRRGVIKSEDVLLYKDGAYVGKKSLFMDGFPHKTCCVNEHVFILRTNDKLPNQFYLYFWLDQEVITKEIKDAGVKAAQPGLNQASVRNLPILTPPVEYLSKYDEQVRPIMNQLFLNANQARELSTLRDTLLPRVISGKIKV